MPHFPRATSIILVCSAILNRAESYIEHGIDAPRLPSLGAVSRLNQRQTLYCPLITDTLCSSGLCCQTGLFCCGSFCCADPCSIYLGTVACSNMNFCCPPGAGCFVDGLGSPYCGSVAGAMPDPTTDPVPAPTPDSSSDPSSDSGSESDSDTNSGSDVDSESDTSSASFDSFSSTTSTRPALAPSVIGGIVGAVVFFLILLGLGIWFLITRRRKRQAVKNSQRRATYDSSDRMEKVRVTTPTVRSLTPTELDVVPAPAPKIPKEQVDRLQQKYRILKNMHDEMKINKTQRAMELRNQLAKKVAKMALKKAVKHFVLHGIANVIIPVGGSLIVGGYTAMDVADTTAGAIDAFDVTHMTYDDAVNITDLAFPAESLNDPSLWNSGMTAFDASQLADDMNEMFADFRRSPLSGAEYSAYDGLFDYPG